MTIGVISPQAKILGIKYDQLFKKTNKILVKKLCIFGEKMGIEIKILTLRGTNSYVGGGRVSNFDFFSYVINE